MAEASEEVPGSNSDTEAEVEREAPKIKQRVTAITENMKTPCQPQDKEREKVQKILSKVKLALQLSAEKRKKRKSTILVCYHRQSKKKNENQPKEEEESPTPDPGSALCLPGVKDLEVAVTSPETALQRWMLR
ncbi:uncharacterized protein LOC116583546 [Mustela erminea]|uniref:uncharacterized protein LOC116583546 n=1 Tax=Mustela erminea TaxID=36723 RepID=UPI001386F947|nr:uncharacterized protein LOC116583546 [Mustela erminea]